MSATAPSFIPAPSRQAARLRAAGYLFLLFSLTLWPTPLTPFWLLLQAGVALMVLLFWWRGRGQQPRGFVLNQDGQGRWLSEPSRFVVSARSRLLPGMVLLHCQPGGWQWWHQDSFDEAQWRRLCRLTLAIQRGESTVGSDSGKVSG
ncbi:protein YgfX [Ferrimonas marina]|uniref:Toxin CptA n=1 Tax=Ferrimonas marina TaxID=299255 RepID=A0A1M5ZG77_9GAMM|nr:protein YgfX [Ferrimonas marina]SHI23256.1 hypothetical protein SAMN02745129_0280 [Ferrimonas marina]